MDKSGRQINLRAKQSIISLFFSKRYCFEEIQYLIDGFEKKGYDLEEFWWMNAELEPKASELRSLLANGNYGLSEEQTNLYIRNYGEKTGRF